MTYQSKNWESIAQSLLRTLFKKVDDCHAFVLERVCQDKDVRTRLSAWIDPSRCAAEQVAWDYLDTIILDEREGHLLKENNSLTISRKEAQAERIICALQAIGFRDKEQYHAKVSFDAIRAAVCPINNEQSTLQETHDLLFAYYEVALARFVDNVKVQVVERLLLGEGSLRVLSSDRVALLTDWERAVVAGEDEKTTEQRRELLARQEKLNLAKQLCATKTI